MLGTKERVWIMRWETENGAMINPLGITVYGLCAPRL
jgi:hypothetical protein